MLGLFRGRSTILVDPLQTLPQYQLRLFERIQIEERLRVKTIDGGIAWVLGYPTRAQDPRRFKAPMIVEVFGKPAHLLHRDGGVVVEAVRDHVNRRLQIPRLHVAVLAGEQGGDKIPVALAHGAILRPVPEKVITRSAYYFRGMVERKSCARLSHPPRQIEGSRRR